MAAACCALALVPSARGQDASEAARRQDLDQVLDTYVRDGFVYYRALKLERAKLDRYLSQIETVNGASVDGWPEREQLAFWLNAYDALVLRTVIDHYPIQGHAAGYPSKSIRQVPGAFERLTHRVAGRTLTLDQIEQTVLTRFHDPRVFLAVGRGAVGSGRLRSEVFTPERVDSQLAEVAAECTNHQQCVQVEPAANKLVVNPIFSWREGEFVSADASKALPVFSTRSPIERAILALVSPTLLASERDFLQKNTFQLAYGTFDWTLNDLTGRGDR